MANAKPRRAATVMSVNCMLKVRVDWKDCLEECVEGNWAEDVVDTERNFKCRLLPSLYRSLEECKMWTLLHSDIILTWNKLKESL
jgi:hypothetical protein